MEKEKTPNYRTQKDKTERLNTMSGAGFYIAYPMGIGKSKICIDYIYYFNLNPVLVICPKSVINEWPRQFSVHGHDKHIRCTPLSRGSVTERLTQAKTAMARGPCVLVINYDAVWRNPFGEWALQQKWAMVIADELHRAQEGRTRISKFLHKLRDTTPRRVGLSGTPIPNNPLNLWSQCKFLDPGLFGDSFVAFRARYAIMGGFNQKEVVAFRNLEDLNRRFYQIAHRVALKDAIDLPETSDEERVVDLSKRASDIYTEIETSFVARIKEGTINVSNALTELLRLQQLTGGVAAVQEREKPVEVDSSKNSALTDILQDLPREKPVVVFCRFHHDLDVVHKAAGKAHRECAELSGRVNQLDAWRDTETAKQPTVLAVQIKTGGLGIDLTRAHYAVYYSLGFSLAEYEQSRARLHRKGQTRNVTYYHLLTRKTNGQQTVDRKVYKALQAKEKVVEKILAEVLDE